MKKTCAECELVFETIYPDKKYCSSSCQWRASDIRRGRRNRRGRRRGKLNAVQFVYIDKILKGCARCPERRPFCLQYHHIDPATKKGNISQLVNVSLKAVQEEIAKCILLCANCHSVEEHGDGYRSDVEIPSISRDLRDTRKKV